MAATLKVRVTQAVPNPALDPGVVIGFRAFCRRGASPEAFCGRIVIGRHYRRVKGRKVFSVEHVDVVPAFQRQGVATKLYTAAADAACDRHGRLASMHRSVDAHSNAFWQKQVAKGRAVSVRRRHGQPPIYLLDRCPTPSLRGARR